MTDPILYLPQVAWETMVKNVRMITDWTYYITVSPDNLNDVGAGTKEVGFYFIDNNGEQYSITAINVGGVGTDIEVTDDFKCGLGPVSDRTGIVYEAVGNSRYLAQVMYSRLDSTAQDKARAIDLAVLWDSFKKHFTELLDCPSSYVGQALKSLRVKADMTGIEFYTPPSSVNESVQALSGLTPSWNTLNGIHATLTLSGNTTITLSNLIAGQSGNLTITNPTTVYTLTFAGYTNEISPAIWKVDNQPIVSGLTLKDAFSWYYNGTLLLWNGTNGYKP